MIVDVEREVAVVVAAVQVDEDDDTGCLADPCLGAVRGACSVYLSAKDYLLVPG